MRTLVLLVCLTLATLSSSLDCGDGKIRGVNLGSWLMTEPWISPYFYEAVNVGENADRIVDEWTYAEYLDPDEYHDNMKTHWDTWMTKEDFMKVSSAGVTYVRIPVGYWYWDVVEGEPFPPPNPDDTDDNSALFYLKRGLVWLDELGMKAEIDLHGAPGSQNGFDNSGKRGDVHWVDETYPENRDNVARTLDILDKIAKQMKGWIEEGAFSRETLYGISLLNEPGGWEENLWTACREDFYLNGYEVIREHFDADVFVNIQQAFRNSSDFYGYMPESEGYQSVSLDMHTYQCFDPVWNSVADLPLQQSWELHLAASCEYSNDVSRQNLPTFSGEFSLAVTDCQKYVNQGLHTPYVPPFASPEACQYYDSDFSSFTDEYKEFLAKFFLAQLDGYEFGESGAGWFMWTIKTEQNCAPEWDFIFLLENGIIPDNLCEREAYCAF